jgi:hypothetical protein
MTNNKVTEIEWRDFAAHSLVSENYLIIQLTNSIALVHKINNIYKVCTERFSKSFFKLNCQSFSFLVKVI